MFLEQNNQIDGSIAEGYPSIDLHKDNKADTLQKFIDSFEGIYLMAGNDKEKQAYYMIMNILRLEGLLSQDVNKNLSIIKLLAGMLNEDSEMQETLRLVVEKYGR